MNRWLIIFLLPALVLGSCRTSQISNIGIPDAYDSKANFTDFAYVVYHWSDQTSRLYYRINTSGLLYSKNLNEQKFKTRYKIHYELYSHDDPKNLKDSLSVYCSDSVNYEVRKELIDSLDLSVSFPGNYLVNLTITDLNRKNSSTAYIDIHKDNYSGRQNYMLKDTSGAIIFNPYISGRQYVNVISRNRQIPRLYVSYYNKQFSAAYPPFVELKEKKITLRPDSIFFVEMSDGCSQNICFPKKGIYHIQEDTAQTEGFTIFRFYDDFPSITSAEQLLDPLCYISTKMEFNDMKLLKNTKEAVDNFWLEKSGNPDRAKEMIRRYYNRVVESNRFFTSYIEGWKTDRGMIYIVYGPPNIVYRNPNSESWIYGEDRNILSMTFVFEKLANPFTNEDYSLEREQEYKDTWITVLDGWRN